MIPEQGSQDWLDWRKTKVGASDAPIIMGVCPFKGTPYKLWQQKLGLIPDNNKTEAMNRGSDLEEMVRVRYNQENDTQMEKAVVQSTFHSWMIASLDGWDGTNAIEIKVSPRTYKKLWEGIVPENYFWQLQHQMFVCDLRVITLVAYNPDTDSMVCMPVKRDNDAIGVMLVKELNFYQCMKNGESPDLMDNDYEYLGKDKYFDELEALWHEGEELELRGKNLKESARKKIIEYAGRPSYGNVIKLSRYQTKGSVDYLSIPELQGVNLDKYRKEPSVVWQIRRIKKEVD